MDFFNDLIKGLSPESKDLIKATLSPTVAILLFFATNVFSIVFRKLEKRSEVRRTVIGIYREIQENMKFAETFLNQADIIDGIKNRIKADDAKSNYSNTTPQYRPLVAITESSKFYDKSTHVIHSIKSKCLVPISAYYRSLEDQKITANSIESYAFLYITVNSRCETVDELWKAFKESVDKGQESLNELAKSYPGRWFKDIKP